VLTLTRLVVPVWRSRTKTSESPFVSPPTRFEANEEKATKRPLAEIEGPWQYSFPCTPAVLTLTRVVVPVPAQPGTAMTPKASETRRTSASILMPRIQGRVIMVVIRWPPRRA
jgi:hypothetical protein